MPRLLGRALTLEICPTSVSHTAASEASQSRQRVCWKRGPGAQGGASKALMRLHKEASESLGRAWLLLCAL